MKRIFCLIFLFAVLTACTANTGTAEGENPGISEGITTEDIVVSGKEEFRAVWLTVYELPRGISEQEYERWTGEVCKSISKMGIDNIFLQVRANGDAIYPSEYFSPMSDICDGGELKADILSLMLKAAREYGLKLHAWINPYRISSDSSYDKNNIMFSHIGAEDISLGDSYTYIKPSSVKGRMLILEGVRELCESYDLDGIHIDDYFYPTHSEEFDKADYDAYLAEGGRLSLLQWRRENVNILVSSIYSLVKNIDEELLFSISPCGDIDKNQNVLCADVELWSGNEGFCDMIIPQIYYGFENTSQPFDECLQRWKEINTCPQVRLCIGLAAYKAGLWDKYAGEGQNEWRENDDILKRQVEYIRSERLDGFAVFSYNYLFGNKNLTNNEIMNFKSVIK